MIPIRDINPTRITPVFTVGLIIANLFVFFFAQPAVDTQEGAEFLYERAAIACELTTNERLTIDEANNDVCIDGNVGTPINPDKSIWLAAVFSMFLHGGLLHILGNMWFLWIFGNNVEEAFGNLGFLALYLIGGLVATAAFVVANPDATVPLVGASGAIAAVLGAYLVLFPRHQVLTLLFVFFVPIPAVVFLLLWFFSQFGIQDVSVAWEAHVAGFVFGVLVALPARQFLLRRVASLHATTRYRV
ncbi:MAG: rhomboid family intramembrane serine protease [Acidimicrobiia bacterium]|nr:rhomboid family intramembrane serine protease [Acidimicrobiia bacterium]